VLTGKGQRAKGKEQRTKQAFRVQSSDCGFGLWPLMFECVVWIDSHDENGNLLYPKDQSPKIKGQRPKQQSED
jgi:hypothetical protein